MSAKVMAKVDLRRFTQALLENFPVFGPRAKGSETVFDRIQEPEEMALEYVSTILPPKKLLFPPEEVLFRFSRGNHKPQLSGAGVSETFVLFGLHPCDLHAIELLDRALADGERDSPYFARRSAAIVIGLDCLPDEECFCASVGTCEAPPNYDLFLTDLGDVYLVEVGSERGRWLLFQHGLTREALPEHLVQRDAHRRTKAASFSKHLDTHISNLPLLFETFYRSGVWADRAEKCLSCGSCNIVCPTCFCFDVLDRLNLSLSEGERVRRWDGCLLPEFALVASGENFRGEGAARYRHRFFRKFQYLAVRYRQVFCVGCGRCGRACVARIADPVETINAVLAERGYVSLTPAGASVAPSSVAVGGRRGTHSEEAFL